MSFLENLLGLGPRCLSMVPGHPRLCVQDKKSENLVHYADGTVVLDDSCQVVDLPSSSNSSERLCDGDLCPQH